MTIWDRLLKENFIEEIQWYIFTDVNVKNYFGIKLSTTALSTVSECTEENQIINWDEVDLATYEEEKLNSDKLMHPTICCPEVLNAVVDLYRSCSNSICRQKVIILPGARMVHCSSCNRRSKSTSCTNSFEATVEFENITLSLQLDILGSFINEDILTNYSHKNIDSLNKKSL